jgi:hypothetical protein
VTILKINADGTVEAAGREETEHQAQRLLQRGKLRKGKAVKKGQQVPKPKSRKP